MKVGNTKVTINLRQVEEEMLKRHMEGKKMSFSSTLMLLVKYNPWIFMSILYSISPIDFIPDPIPLLGSLDDTIILLMPIYKMFRETLESRTQTISANNSMVSHAPQQRGADIESCTTRASGFVTRAEQGPRVSSYAEQGPYVSSYAEQGPRLSSHTEQEPRVSSYAEQGPRVPSYAEQGPRLSSHTEQEPRVSSYAEQGPRLSSHTEQGSRLSSHAEQGPRLSSHAEQGSRVSSHAEQRPRVSSHTEQGSRPLSHAEQGPGPSFSAEQEPDWSARRTQKPGLTEERPSQVQDMSGRLRDIYTKINAMSVGETQTEAFQTRDAKEDNGQTI